MLRVRVRIKNKARIFIFKQVAQYFGYFSLRRRFAFKPKYWASGLNSETCIKRTPWGNAVVSTLYRVTA